MLHCKVLHPEKALDVLANIRPTRKNLAGANAPVYFAAQSAPKKKSFVILNLGWLRCVLKKPS